mmetsp:Transcript_1431/g.2272  ORF Transcript_1431/g.2272 Transcript_1431/m.2272 type:complete len:303 (-) Transcript_1431:12-920(-)
MPTPSAASIIVIPAAKRSGKTIAIATCHPPTEPFSLAASADEEVLPLTIGFSAINTRRATSVEVSKLKLNTSPKKNIFQGLSTNRKAPERHLVKQPPSMLPLLFPDPGWAFLSSIRSDKNNITFRIPNTSRTMAENNVPISRPKSARGPSIPRSVAADTIVIQDITRTIKECPIPNISPTETGIWPWPTSLRVTLSMAAMWSASTACLRPKVQASNAREKNSCRPSKVEYAAARRSNPKLMRARITNITVDRNKNRPFFIFFSLASSERVPRRGRQDDFPACMRLYRCTTHAVGGRGYCTEY